MKKVTLKIDDKEIEAEIKDRDYKELAKPKKKGLWVPDYGEDYWYVGDTGYIYEGLWDGGHTDYFKLGQNNVFRTEEEAEKEAEKRKALVRIRKYIHENDMYFEPDWSDINQPKCSIYYNHAHKEFMCETHFVTEETSIIPYLPSKKHGYQVIKDCKEDLKIVSGIN